jgi:hypothetical protein
VAEVRADTRARTARGELSTPRVAHGFSREVGVECICPSDHEAFPWRPLHASLDLPLRGDELLSEQSILGNKSGAVA